MCRDSVPCATRYSRDITLAAVRTSLTSLGRRTATRRASPDTSLSTPGRRYKSTSLATSASGVGRPRGPFACQLWLYVHAWVISTLLIAIAGRSRTFDWLFSVVARLRISVHTGLWSRFSYTDERAATGSYSSLYRHSASHSAVSLQSARGYRCKRCHTRRRGRTVDCCLYPFRQSAVSLPHHRKAFAFHRHLHYSILWLIFRLGLA